MVSFVLNVVSLPFPIRFRYRDYPVIIYLTIIHSARRVVCKASSNPFLVLLLDFVLKAYELDPSRGFDFGFGFRICSLLILSRFLCQLVSSAAHKQFYLQPHPACSWHAALVWFMNSNLRQTNAQDKNGTRTRLESQQPASCAKSEKVVQLCPQPEFDSSSAIRQVQVMRVINWQQTKFCWWLLALSARDLSSRNPALANRPRIPILINRFTLP